MGLTPWPEKFRDDEGNDSRGETVDLIFDDGEGHSEIHVKAASSAAIGLSYDEFGDIDYWIPKSQIDGDIPKRGEWIDTLRIPKWLADDKGLDYEW